MPSNAMDSRITVTMFLQSMQGRFQKLLAGTLTPQEKLAAIVRELETETQQKRVLAREIGAQMRALADPDTRELEPLEASRLRRTKLVALGGQNLGNAEMLGQIQQEIKSLESVIGSQQATYDTLKESYDLAMANYKTALQALDNARINGPAILNAIKAHEQALQLRDKTKKQGAPDVTFMSELTAELDQTRAELRSDKEIEDDVDATKAGSLDAALAAMDAGHVDDSLMAEFQAAANASGATAQQQAAAGAAATFQVTVEPTTK